MNRPAFKKIFRILGNLAMLAAVFYLLATLAENTDRISLKFSIVVPVAVVLFACTHLLQTRVIQIILRQNIAYLSLLKIHSASQVYKYLPGNVAHFFSRWLFLKRSGVAARDNARLIVYETALLVAAFGLLGCIFLAVCPGPFSLFFVSHPGQVAGGVVPGLSVACYVYRRRIRQIFSAWMLLVLLLYILSALLAGLILSLVAAFMVPEISGVGFSAYVSGFALAFLAGFVVPGSPGGIGIRELVFVELFRYSGNEAYLLVQLMVVYRLTAIVTELLMFVATKFCVPDPE